MVDIQTRNCWGLADKDKRLDLLNKIGIGMMWETMRKIHTTTEDITNAKDEIDNSIMSQEPWTQMWSNSHGVSIILLKKHNLIENIRGIKLTPKALEIERGEKATNYFMQLQ